MPGVEPHLYNSMGSLYLKLGAGGCTRSQKLAVENFQKYFDMVKGRPGSAELANATINRSKAKSLFDGMKHGDLSSELKTQYQLLISRFGEHDPGAIRTGIDYASSLIEKHHTIEAERLLLKLFDLSRQTHGNDHKLTSAAKSNLEHCKQRHVKVKCESGGESDVFVAVRYDSSGEMVDLQKRCLQCCLIHNATSTVATSEITLCLGTPVVCCGFEGTKIAYLNGMIGDIRCVDEEKNSYMVYFEDTSIEPRLEI